MKKTFIFLFVLFSMSCMAITATAGAKEKTKQIGKFKYTYSFYSSTQIWIQNIEPVSGKGIGTLKIPSSIDGKKVVKLGWKYDSEEDDYVTTNANIFGLSVSEDDGQLRPEKMIRRVRKIKKIILPDTIKIITAMCFGMLEDGKCINIPSKVEKGVEKFCFINWGKLTVSPKNKKYKVKNGLLLSKNGKTAYGSVQSMSKMRIPKGVKKLDDWGKFANSKVTDVYIPSSLNKIGTQTLVFPQEIKFHVSKKNKIYAVTKDCVYNKKTGRLVAASAHGSTFTVPEQVIYLSDINFSGKKVKKMIIPASVKKISHAITISEKNIIYEFKSKKPPIFKNKHSFENTILYVPKGSKKAYQNALKETNGVYVEATLFEK